MSRHQKLEQQVSHPGRNKDPYFRLNDPRLLCAECDQRAYKRNVICGQEETEPWEIDDCCSC